LPGGKNPIDKGSKLINKGKHPNKWIVCLARETGGLLRMKLGTIEEQEANGLFRMNLRSGVGSTKVKRSWNTGWEQEF
jgi:hypothetical protein